MSILKNDDADLAAIQRGLMNTMTPDTTRKEFEVLVMEREGSVLKHQTLPVRYLDPSVQMAWEIFVEGRKKSEDTRRWQSIETAPKDGTPILLTWDWDSGMHTGRTVILAHWMCRKHSHLSSRHCCPNEQGCDMGWGNYKGKFPYWMPLPSALTAIAQQEGEGK